MRLETGGLRVYGPRSPVREAFRLSSFSGDGTCAQPPAPAMANLNTVATRGDAAAVLGKVFGGTLSATKELLCVCVRVRVCACACVWGN